MICDLCQEWSRAEERCDQCGHEIRTRPAPPRQEVPAPFPPRGCVPFDHAMAPLRARHHGAIVAVQEWALAAGRPLDRDVAALCLDVLEKDREEEWIRLDRRDVAWLLRGRMHNETSIADTRLPEGWVGDVWTVLRFLVETGRLDPASDPPGPLLEPLQCYGGLDADGWPRPEGVDVDFPCQCYFPHDPDCPPELGQHEVGRDREDGTEFVVRARMVNRSEDVPMSAFGPLTKLARRLRARNSYYIVALDQFFFVGTVPATKRTPELWIYRFAPELRRGFAPVVVDEHGSAFRAKRNRTYKAGFRWQAIDDEQAAWVCGLASWTFDRPRPGDWVPDPDDPDSDDESEAGPPVLVRPPSYGGS